MTNLFIAYVAAFFLPLLFYSWRVAVLGLAAQGFILAIIAAHHQHTASVESVVEAASLALTRGGFAPWYLFRCLRGRQPIADFSLIAKNFVQWLFAFFLLVIAFVFGNKMSPTDPQEALQIGVAAGAILIGLLILANQNHPLGQIVGLLTFEGGVTLVELLSPHAMPLPVAVGVTLVFVVFVLACGQYLINVLAIPNAPASLDNEEVL